MEEWRAIVDMMGGGLPAVVILFMGLAIRHLWRALIQSYEQRIAREKEHSIELARTIETVRAFREG